VCRTQETVRSLKERACAAFGVDPSTVELWDFFHNSKYANLEGHMDKDLEEARILDEQPILLDDKVRRGWGWRGCLLERGGLCVQLAAAGQCTHRAHSQTSAARQAQQLQERTRC
jgi:hypothetical protein